MAPIRYVIRAVRADLRMLSARPSDQGLFKRFVHIRHHPAELDFQARLT
ncbi:hypothetical protein [Amycolatopsis sp. lyj-90]